MPQLTHIIIKTPSTNHSPSSNPIYKSNDTAANLLENKNKDVKKSSDRTQELSMNIPDHCRTSKLCNMEWIILDCMEFYEMSSPQERKDYLEK